MSYKTPNSKKQKSQQPSPASVTQEITSSGELMLNEEALQYLQTILVSEDDPCFLIHWTSNGVSEALEAVHGGILRNLPDPPEYILLDDPE
jgi:hypothetical protein